MSFEQQLYEALRGTLGPDTETIKASTAALQEAYKNPLVVPSLYTIALPTPAPSLSTPPTPDQVQSEAIRQLAAVELRKRVAILDVKKDSAKGLWAKNDQGTRDTIKRGLLERIPVEHNSKVRSSLIYIVAELGRIELCAKTWPELSSWVAQAAQSDVAAHKEIGLLVLLRILEMAFQYFDANLSQLLDLLRNSMNFQESLEVRVTAIRAIGRIAEMLEEENDKPLVDGISSILVDILGIAGQACQDKDGEQYKHAFEVVETFVFADEAAYLNAQNFPTFVNFLVTIASTTDLRDEVRSMALSTLLICIRYKRAHFTALGTEAINHVTDKVLLIGPENPEDLDDEIEENPAANSFRVIDGLVNALPPDTVCPHLFSQLQQLFTHPNAPFRRTGFFALSVSIEGCSMWLSDHVEGLFPYVGNGLTDPDPQVKKAACTALVALCEWLPEECSAKHADFMQRLFSILPDPEVQKAALRALESHVEILGDDIIPYLPELMERMVVFLDQVPLEMKGAVMGVIGSAAHASKEKFAPYFTSSMERIYPLVHKKESKEEVELRALALDTIAQLAKAAGAQAFQPYRDPLLQVAFESILLDDSSLTECSFTFFCAMAKIYGQEFAAPLPAVVQAMLKSLGAVESEVVSLEALDKAIASGSYDEGAEDVFVDVEDEEEDDFGISGIVLEKTVAAEALGEIFEYTGPLFFPMVEPCVQAIKPLLSHYYGALKHAAGCTLLGFVRHQYNAMGAPAWTAGLLKSEPLLPELQQLSDTILPDILNALREEDESDVVRAILEELSATLSDVGPGLLVTKNNGTPDTRRLDDLCSIVLDVLQGKSLCQVSEFPSIEPGAEARSENDSVLIAAAGDIVARLAECLGADFAQAFNSFLPSIAASFYGQGRSADDRHTALGAIAEVIGGMQESIAQFTEPLVQMTLAGLRDTAPAVRGNAAFAIGELAYYTGPDFDKHVNSVLLALHPLFELPDSPPAGVSIFSLRHARDNAIGAVARLILSHTSALPVEQVLPTFFNALPLLKDYSEYDKTLLAIVRVFELNLGAPYIDQTLVALADASRVDAEAQAQTDESYLREETKQKVAQLLGQLPADRVAAAGLAAGH